MHHVAQLSERRPPRWVVAARPVAVDMLIHSPSNTLPEASARQKAGLDTDTDVIVDPVSDNAWVKI